MLRTWNTLTVYLPIFPLVPVQILMREPLDPTKVYMGKDKKKKKLNLSNNKTAQTHNK